MILTTIVACLRVISLLIAEIRTGEKGKVSERKKGAACAVGSFGVAVGFCRLVEGKQAKLNPFTNFHALGSLNVDTP